MVGITGGIGSGKSMASGFLKELGAYVIDADLIARQIVEKGQKAYDEIVEYFGHNVLNEDGSLDRKKLGTIVFKNSAKLKALNDITHKYIIEKVILELKEASNRCERTVVVDAAIPFNKIFAEMADEIWVVVADREKRISRVMERNGLSREDAVDRIEAQMKDEEYLKLADRVIANNGSIEDLRLKIMRLFTQFRQGGFIDCDS
ncbi:MAG: dephospho-CoA kinase [Clostridia bacterium]|nr:dephospho-CoA kinase [Clostridia bacterium]